MLIGQFDLVSNLINLQFFKQLGFLRKLFQFESYGIGLCTLFKIKKFMKILWLCTFFLGWKFNVLGYAYYLNLCTSLISLVGWKFSMLGYAWKFVQTLYTILIGCIIVHWYILQNDYYRCTLDYLSIYLNYVYIHICYLISWKYF